MPLTRGRIVGHDSERLAFKFTMQNGGDTVDCQISDAAMDELAGVNGTESLARQAQFMALREAVERIASDMFDADRKGLCHQDIHQAHPEIAAHRPLDRRLPNRQPALNKQTHRRRTSPP